MANCSNLFLDYDGTILNSMGRVYALFRELAPGSGLNYESYWALKRDGVKQEAILKKFLGYGPEAVAGYKKQWLTLIEEPSRLAADFVIPGLTEFLARQAGRRKIIIVTNRQFKDRAVNQAAGLGLTSLCSDFLVTGQSLSKADLIRRSGLELSGEDVFLGDGGEDMLAAKELNIKAGAVTWGFLNRRCLALYTPDFYIETETDLDNCPFI
jgi:phosphoglycolate phosphatase